MYRSAQGLALIGAAVICACSQKDAAKSDSTPVAQAGASTPAVAGYDPTTRVATIHGANFAFTGPDSLLAGWTTFHFVNDGPDLHLVQIIRLDNGKTASDLLVALKNPGPLPSWEVDVGGPNAVDPKSSSNATLNLQPGNYVMMCFVDLPDHVPHLAKGMVHPFKVTPSSTAGAAPTADINVALSDYAFTVQTGALSAGKHTIKVVNNGPQSHELELIRLAPGKTLKDFTAWLEKFDGPPPAGAVGGVAGLTKGLDGYFDVDLTPGNYALVCFAPDAKDGRTHLAHGMVKEFTVQ